jgi:hypothetical protein
VGRNSLSFVLESGEKPLHTWVRPSLAVTMDSNDVASDATMNR